MARNALLCRPDQMRRKPPLGQRDFASLKDRSDRSCELALALIAVAEAGAGALGRQSRNPRLVCIAAMRANGTVRPNDLFERFAGGCFVSEAGVLQFGGHGSLLWRAILHAALLLSR